MKEKKLILENGREFYGKGFGADREYVAEIVFNTSVVGYQEVLSDPSYTGQIVLMTYPLIGNYGMNDDDYESKSPSMSGLIVRDYTDTPSNFRSTKTLSEAMEDYGIPGISGVDTREIARIIRDEGSQRSILTDADTPKEEAMKKLLAWSYPRDVVRMVGCKKRWYSRTNNPRYNVAAIDCGIKLNIVREMNRMGCNVTVLPFDTPASEILRLDVDGVFLSNGPGNPEDVKEVIQTVRELRGKLPIFGICLGHQMIALACGAKTYKMKFGHRGGNHPVKNLQTGRIEITSQNHSYAVDPNSLAGTGLAVTHENLLDHTVEGLEDADSRMFSVQYHPESAPGPQDSDYLFARFLKNMDAAIEEKKKLSSAGERLEEDLIRRAEERAVRRAAEERERNAIRRGGHNSGEETGM